jgi:hypothetical protein
MSTLESACEPPLRMFIIGTGRTWALGRRRSGTAAGPESAAARATASETPRMALAPSFSLLACRRWRASRSMSRWSLASKPMHLGAISSMTASTALLDALAEVALLVAVTHAR